MKENYINKNYLTMCKSIAILSKKFDNVAIPVKISYLYDLLVEKDYNIFKVKIITAECRASSGSYIANIRKSVANGAGKCTYQPFNNENCDYVYVETPEDCYLIPTISVRTTRSLSLSMYQEYIIPS